MSGKYAEADSSCQFRVRLSARRGFAIERSGVMFVLRVHSDHLTILTRAIRRAGRDLVGEVALQLGFV